MASRGSISPSGCVEGTRGRGLGASDRGIDRVRVNGLQPHEGGKFRFVNCHQEASSAASAGGNVFPLRYVVHIFFFLLRTLFQARILVTSACLPALMPNAERPGVASRTHDRTACAPAPVATMATPTDPVGIISRSLAAMVMGLDNQWRVHACCSAKGRG